NDILFVGGSGPFPYTFSAYDLKNDEFIWQKEFPDVYSGLDDVPPAIYENIVVTNRLEKAEDGQSPEHFIYVMDSETGELLWKESFGVGEFVKNNKSGAPMIYKDNVYVGSPITKTFYAYDLNTGKKIWEFENEVMKAPPVAKDDVVYFSNVKGFVYALDSKTGDLLGEVELGGTLAPSGPIIVNDTIFIGSQDTNVYAVPLTDFEIDESEDNLASAEDSDDDSNRGKESVENDFPWKYLFIGGLGLALLIVISYIFNRRKRNL